MVVPAHRFVESLSFSLMCLSFAQVQLLANHLANVVGELHWSIQRCIVPIADTSGSRKIAMKRTVAVHGQTDDLSTVVHAACQQQIQAGRAGNKWVEIDRRLAKP